jgi:serine phosphatase RsbU (regulator of sigma subunit)
MTMIAYSILDRIVHVYKITDPATILEKMHEEVKHALLQDETGNRDGMDVAIITIEKNGNNQSIVTFAGAKRPMFIQNIKNNEIDEIRGKRRAIGGYQDENIHFDNHVLELSQGTMVYLSSDGYADQNDMERKKFSEDRLKKLFEKIALMSTQKQHEIVSELITKYMENTEQRDDILLIGVRV